MTKFLTGSKVYLRRLTKDDCRGRYLEMVNDSYNLRYVEGIGYRQLDPLELEQYVESSNNESNLLLGIFENGSDIHVGNIHLSQIKPHHNNCALGIIMHRDSMGKGYAFEATNLVVRHAFDMMKLHRITIPVVVENVGAIKLYEGIGARREGVLKESFHYDGKYIDIFVYGFLKEYLERQQTGGVK
ncbi:MAG: GNAT family protein [Candidatus Omnitrophota bacterium]